MRVLVFGDSITQGFWSIEGGWVERLRKHYDALALENLRNNHQPEIFNLGVSGDTTFNLLTRIESETRVRKWPRSSLFVLVAIGTNDDLFQSGKQRVQPEEFRENIQKIIKILSQLADGIMFVGTTACDESKTTPVFWSDIHYTNEQMKKYETIVSNVSRKDGVAFVPIFEAFQQKLDEGLDLLADGLHPNDEGHQLIFELVRPELDRLLNT